MSEALMTRRTVGVARLSEKETEALEARHPELAGIAAAGDRGAITIAASDTVLSALEQLSHRLAWEAEQADRVLAALTADAGRGVLDEGRVLQLRRQAELQSAFLRSVELLTSAEVGRLGRSAARNASALASRWKKEGRLFAVPSGRADLYPAFQFDAHGQPRPVIAEVLRHFVEESEWGRALWWTAPSGWLGGRRPLDVLDAEPEAVLEAARRSAQPLEV
jgi:hypothetical protein